jgi:hypothetical protein
VEQFDYGITTHRVKYVNVKKYVFLRQRKEMIIYTYMIAPGLEGKAHCSTALR